MSLGLRSLPPELHDRRSDVVQRLFVERFPDDRLGRLRRIRAKWELQSRKWEAAETGRRRITESGTATAEHRCPRAPRFRVLTHGILRVLTHGILRVLTHGLLRVLTHRYSEYSRTGTPSTHTRDLRAYRASSMPLAAHSEQHVRMQHAPTQPQRAPSPVQHAPTHRARTGSGSPKWTSPMRVLRVPPWEYPQYPLREYPEYDLFKTEAARTASGSPKWISPMSTACDARDSWPAGCSEYAECPLCREYPPSVPRTSSQHPLRRESRKSAQTTS